jgi:TetR/AcrR family transcriptional repressor of mexJK operon
LADKSQRLDPRVARSRTAILAAAMERFLAEGYAADLDDIALAAGVSRKTIYNVIGGKELLFRETLPATLSMAERVAADVGTALAVADDVPEALRQTAVRLAEIVVSEPIVNLRRLLIGVADRFPALVHDYYDRAPGRMLTVLAEAFTELHRRGLLQIDDASVAAEQFAYLAIGAALDRALFGVADDDSSGVNRSARAIHGADVFYRAYRPTPS